MKDERKLHWEPLEVLQWIVIVGGAAYTIWWTVLGIKEIGSWWLLAPCIAILLMFSRLAVQTVQDRADRIEGMKALEAYRAELRRQYPDGPVIIDHCEDEALEEEYQVQIQGVCDDSCSNEGSECCDPAVQTKEVPETGSDIAQPHMTGDKSE